MNTHKPRYFNLQIRMVTGCPMATSDDVADALVELADRLRHPTHEDDNLGLIRDTNGTACGGWSFRHSDETAPELAPESVRSWLNR